MESLRSARVSSLPVPQPNKQVKQQQSILWTDPTAKARNAQQLIVFCWRKFIITVLICANEMSLNL